MHESLESAVQHSDFIVLCTPVDTIIPILKTIAPHLSPGTIVTDVGNVKGSICSQAQTIPNDNQFHFIGSHPMAGSEKSGMEYANADLLKQATCIITPTEHSDPLALEKVTQFWSELEMNPVQMSSEEHDTLIAGISHLPHIVASVLAASLSKIPDEQFKYAGGGLKDTTRVAGNQSYGSLYSLKIPNLFLTLSTNLNKHSKRSKISLASEDLDSLQAILNEGQLVRKNH